MKCYSCPLRCGAEREIRAGRCGVKGLTVAKYYLHPFEEPPISFQKGSGTIFFGGCSLRCVFCQNYEVSRARRGKEVSTDELCDIFRQIEDMGAENINLVTPDHVAFQLAEALEKYRPHIPVVYNSSGYVSAEALERIFPLVDIFLPDLKFCSPDLSERYTGRRDYFAVAIRAIGRMAEKEMLWREDGKLLRGLIVRHLVLPLSTGDSLDVLRALKDILPADVPLSIMRQYTPMGNPDTYPELQRKITAREYTRVVEYALSIGFENIYTQDKSSAGKSFIPDWDF